MENNLKYFSIIKDTIKLLNSDFPALSIVNSFYQFGKIISKTKSQQDNYFFSFYKSGMWEIQCVNFIAWNDKKFIKQKRKLEELLKGIALFTFPHPISKAIKEQTEKVLIK